MVTSNESLTREQIKVILYRHRGAAAELARDLGVASQHLSMVLSGRRVSRAVMEAAEARALFLLAEEKTQSGDAA